VGAWQTVTQIAIVDAKAVTVGAKQIARHPATWVVNRQSIRLAMLRAIYRQTLVIHPAKVLLAIHFATRHVMLVVIPVAIPHAIPVVREHVIRAAIQDAMRSALLPVRWDVKVPVRVAMLHARLRIIRAAQIRAARDGDLCNAGRTLTQSEHIRELCEW